MLVVETVSGASQQVGVPVGAVVRFLHDEKCPRGMTQYELLQKVATGMVVCQKKVQWSGDHRAVWRFDQHDGDRRFGVCDVYISLESGERNAPPSPIEGRKTRARARIHTHLHCALSPLAVLRHHAIIQHACRAWREASRHPAVPLPPGCLVSCPLSAVRCPLSAVRCLLSVVRRVSLEVLAHRDALPAFTIGFDITHVQTNAKAGRAGKRRRSSIDSSKLEAAKAAGAPGN